MGDKVRVKLSGLDKATGHVQKFNNDIASVFVEIPGFGQV